MNNYVRQLLKAALAHKRISNTDFRIILDKVPRKVRRGGEEGLRQG